MSEIIVTCTKRQRKRHKRRLRRYGLKHTGENTFIGNVPRRKYTKFCEYCRRYKIRYRINNTFGVRNSGYRTIFFQNHRSVFGNMYFCAYCGRLMKKKNVSVDHIYPVDKVSKSPKMQRKLKLRRMTDVNDKRNLVASCKRCNLRKGTRTGFWIFRGKIGKSNLFWIVRYVIRIVALCYVCLRLYESGVLEKLQSIQI